jgi:selenophosphate synthetase-related protein
MQISEIAELLRNSQQIKKKYLLHPTLQFFKEFGFKNETIFAAFGQDSAAILPTPDSEILTLLTIDEISRQFLTLNPFGAGYSSLFVASDDIYACGGLPIAVCISVGAKNQEELKFILDGINKASEMLNLPVVRGHTSIENETHLTVAAMGTIEKDLFVSSGNARNNDLIALIIDPQGEPSKTTRLYWNSIHENISQLKEKRRVIYRLSKANCIHASKDISNAGIFGTLLQMMELSNMGAEINLDHIKIPDSLKQKNYQLEEFIQMYLTSSFLISLNSDKSAIAERIVRDLNLQINIIGKVNSTKKIIISKDSNTIDLFDFSREKFIF